nr:pentatricopeptide repeat-containing protein At4g14170-like [Ipomoea batatas]
MYIFHRCHVRLSRLASSLSCRSPLHILPQYQWSHRPDILSVCAAAQSLRQIQQTHAQAVLHGVLPSSVSVCAALILRYALFESSSKTVQALFSRSVAFALSPFLYNTLIRAQGMLGFYDQNGFMVYNEMLRSGVMPDDHTFPFVLKLCSEFLEVRKGLEAHGTLLKVGFDSDVYVNNTLLTFYGNCGDLLAAEKVFGEMPEKDLVSWNSIIRAFSDNSCCFDAIRVFRDMLFWSEVKPNAVSVVSTLPVCAALEYGKMSSGIHCYVLKVGLDSQLSIGNALIDAYGKCREIEASKQVFDEMIERNDVSWNASIVILGYNGCYEQALSSFRLMIEKAVDFNATTISSVLPILAELGYFCKGREVHGLCVRMGLDRDVFVSNSLIDMYSKSGRSSEASNVFYNMNMRNAISWNAMIANFAQNSLELEAIGLVRKMQAQGENLTSVTLTNVLPACARLGCVRPGKEIHAKSLRSGFASDLFVSNALIDMYAKCGCLDLAQNVFEISLRDEVSYNILIVGYSLTDDWQESLALFSEMGRLGMENDTVSFVGALSACSNVSAIKQGKEIHGYAVRRLFHSHQFVSNSLLDLYTKCGRIDISRKIFDRMQCRDVASWNTMILGYGMLGELQTAINLFEAMKDDGVEYDSVSFIAVLSACSHGGLIEKGRRYFDDMFAHDIKPTQTHYACMVDLLGRNGLVDEAVHLVQSLPIEADANIWGALLGACRLHGKMELGCWAADHLLKLKPKHSGYYALLSNMYAEAGRWKEADRVRELMKMKGVKKMPGCSWVQMRDGVYAFIVGERFEQLDSYSWLEKSD